MAETKPKRSLSDRDIATFQRRSGPDGSSGGGTDVDTDTHAHTDSDTTPDTGPKSRPKAGTDADAAPATDRDR